MRIVPRWIGVMFMRVAVPEEGDALPPIKEKNKGSLLRRAFESHESHNTLFGDFPADIARAGGEGYVSSRRWKNFQEKAKEQAPIAAIVNVGLSHTGDTGNAVVKLTDADGKTVSLWCSGALSDRGHASVHSVTSY